MGQSNFNSPIGPIATYSEDDCITQIEFNQHLEEEETDSVIESCKTQLTEYFKGQRKTFNVKIKPVGTEFQLRVWNKLKEIPFGKTISYSDLAIRLGDLKAIRAAGTANGKNKIPIIIPCHRVIGKDGSLVGFAGGLEIKEQLLRQEGVISGEQIKIFG
ncbi:methylated-DNA--[protein]-cysteine S-methyltransferase [Fulvivirga lutimaris]|uniref:methylated-DNA--[protein]-cysteine S-methyltransferase n=1 Tax=Fulvivirga lutimaris TaxID=1819566 RepID=UPI0012BC3ABA|nr:methylated-DNA--[protein]-cysteine S-methyltransferase [Fulvivirga lutimaris]MTI40315.1 methylated-DNA--[protein]-cysteine S-methyltransferase [Fulvivirga lutimaris]